ncbi:hypothetical protein [Bacterioplanoides sp.]|uniref:hypothetical protein n=1 Tax=Bacterioplanoides sp. TaxID=2066072 RepID=UPI003B5B201B
MANKRKGNFFDKHKEENKDVNKTAFELYPKFSFEFAVNHSRSLEKLSKDDASNCIKKITQLSKQTWREISNLPRKQGFEKIPKTSFKSLPSPPHKFKEFNQIDVFRLPAKSGRLIGYIEDEVFYVVWIDTKFDMYNH